MGSPAVVMSSPRKSPSTVRRTNKPLVEKKRRARINGCLGQLKSLILSAMKTEGTQVSRLEKADILEMTVKYLRHIQRQQATSSVTSEPEVVAKFSAGYSECAAEVIRYMDSVTGVTPDVRYRLESHLVGRLQGSIAESGVQHVSLSRPDSEPSQIQDQQHQDETSIHYQTALELANMASSVKVIDTLREDHSNSDMPSQQNAQQANVPGSVSYQSKAPSSTERIPRATSFLNQEHVSVRPKTVSPMDISNRTTISTSVSSLSSHNAGQDRQTTVVSTTSALAPFKNEDRHLHENRNEYFNTAPTPPDTPPFNSDINNNDVTIPATGGYIYLKEREVYINQTAFGNTAIPPVSPINRNSEMTSRDEGREYGRDYVIKHASNSFITKDVDIEMKNDSDRSGSESDPCLRNSAMIYDNYQRNYNLSVYQQPLHIHIPDSPTPTTPSPPQLFPSHVIQEQQQAIYSDPAPNTVQQRNNSNAVLPTILYGMRGSEATAISGAIDFRSEQAPPPLPTNASKTQTDDVHSYSQSTCNLGETNCSNTADSRSQSQIPIFKQSTWPVGIEHAQNSQFQGHSNEQLSQSQPQRQRSPSSSPLSPPTLTREDLRPLGSRASNESDRALEYFDYNDHSRTALCRMRRNSHDNHNSNSVASSRRLTFDENTTNVQTNGMASDSVAFYRREHGCQSVLYSRSGGSEHDFRNQQEAGLDIKNKDRICCHPSPCFSSTCSLHEDQTSPRSSPVPPPPLHQHPRHLSEQEHYSYSQRAQVNQHHQLYQCKYPNCKEEKFPSSFTPFRRRGDHRGDDPYTHHRKSSSSSSPTTSSWSPSPPTIVPSHVLAHSEESEGMRSLYQEPRANASHYVNSTAGHHLHHCHNNNMNGPTMSEARDLSRQNVSPLSSPTLKRVMMGHGSEVSARPRCTDARPVEGSLQRIGGQPGVRGQGFAILRRVPQDTPIPIERVPPPIEHIRTPIERATMEEGSFQATQTTTAEFTEERLWRPW